MPKLKLGELSDPADAYKAACDIRAVMAWPSDSVARSRYLAGIMARNLGLLQQSGHKLEDPAAAPDWIAALDAMEDQEAWRNTADRVSDWLDEAGGLVTATEGPGIEALEKYAASQVKAWFAAGWILALIRRMAEHHPDLPGGASVNKAVHIAERVPPPGGLSNSYDLRRAWTTYKPVAHFCSAVFDVCLRANEASDGDLTSIAAVMEDRLHEVLAEAEAYLTFGLAHVPPRAKGVSLLDPAAAWLLPPERQWAPSPYRPTPLAPSLLDAVRSYRAPIPGA